MGKRKLDAQKLSIELGKRIRTLRRRRGWTLEDCEEHGWKNWRDLQSIESGRNITLKTLVNIANLFSIHPSELLKDL